MKLDYINFKTKNHEKSLNYFREIFIGKYFKFNRLFKGTVSVISSEPLMHEDDNSRFTTVPLKP